MCIEVGLRFLGGYSNIYINNNYHLYLLFCAQTFLILHENKARASSLFLRQQKAFLDSVKGLSQNSLNLGKFKLGHG